MSKKIYQITGHIIADNVSNVNLYDSGNIGGTPPPSIRGRNSGNSSDNFRGRHNHTTLRIIGCILLILALAYCLWMCIHYNIQHYPSAVVTSKPADYFGMIVGFFSLLVTLLVGWQIWQTMVARREIESVLEVANDVENIRRELYQTREVSEAHFWDAEATRLFGNEDYLLSFVFHAQAAQEYIRADVDYGRWAQQAMARMDAALNNLENGLGNVAFFINQSALVDNTLMSLIGAINLLSEDNQADARDRIRRIQNRISAIRANSPQPPASGV